jgi:hypothetical protein
VRKWRFTHGHNKSKNNNRQITFLTWGKSCIWLTSPRYLIFRDGKKRDSSTHILRTKYIPIMRTIILSGKTCTERGKCCAQCMALNLLKHFETLHTNENLNYSKEYRLSPLPVKFVQHLIQYPRLDWFTLFTLFSISQFFFAIHNEISILQVVIVGRGTK